MLSIISSSLVKIQESFWIGRLNLDHMLSKIFNTTMILFIFQDNSSNSTINRNAIVWNFFYESNTIYFVKIYNKPHGTKPSRMPYMYCDRWQLVKISRSWALLEKLQYKAFNKYVNRAVNTKYYDVIILFKYVF